MNLNTDFKPTFSVDTRTFPIENQKDLWATGEIYIKFHEKLGIPEDRFSKKCTKLLEKHNLTIIEARGQFELIVKQAIGSNQHPLNITAELQQSKLVELAEADIASEIQKCPS